MGIELVFEPGELCLRHFHLFLIRAHDVPDAHRHGNQDNLYKHAGKQTAHIEGPHPLFPELIQRLLGEFRRLEHPGQVPGHQEHDVGKEKPLGLPRLVKEQRNQQIVIQSIHHKQRQHQVKRSAEYLQGRAYLPRDCEVHQGRSQHQPYPGNQLGKVDEIILSIARGHINAKIRILLHLHH